MEQSLAFGPKQVLQSILHGKQVYPEAYLPSSHVLGGSTGGGVVPPPLLQYPHSLV